MKKFPSIFFRNCVLKLSRCFYKCLLPLPPIPPNPAIAVLWNSLCCLSRFISGSQIHYFHVIHIPNILINHIYNSCKSYFLLINIGPRKLPKLRWVILSQNNSWSCLVSSKLGLSITKTTIMHSKMKKKHFYRCYLYINKEKERHFWSKLNA